MKLRRALCSFTAIISLTLTVETSFCSAVQGKTLQGSVMHNEMIDNLERVGIKCYVQQGAVNSAKAGSADKLVIDTVRLGSKAYYSGIAAGDIVKSVATPQDKLLVTVERNGQVFQAQIASSAPLLSSATTNQLTGRANQTGADLLKQRPLNAKDTLPPVLDVTQPNFPQHQVKNKPDPLVDVKEKEKEKKLQPIDVELIIDRTGSMSEIDGTGNKTKFEWCYDQVRNFSERLAPYHKLVTITTFNTTYNVEYDCNPSRVAEIYGTLIPQGNTDVVDPLTNRMNAALAAWHPGGRPRLIAVIFDGLPNVPRDPHVVNEAIIEATQRMQEPGQLMLTFLQIGDTFDGQSFAKELDSQLVSQGAKYDIVDTQTFAELKQKGLLDALVDAVVKTSLRGNGAGSAGHGGSVGAGNSASNSAAELERLRKERAEIEKRIFSQ